MTERREDIAELYYRSHSVKTEGYYELSVHRDQPNLRKSPWYLHYPKHVSEPGFALLPRLFELIGEEFADMWDAQNPVSIPQRIAGHPTGAWGLGDAWARHYSGYPANLIMFDKIQHPDGRTTYDLLGGAYEKGALLEPCEDHISSARNNRLYVAHARSIGFVVTRIFAVVDRQQGGRENLAAEGVTMHSIFTADELLDHGLAQGHIRQGKFDEIQEYRVANQFSLAHLKHQQ